MKLDSALKEFSERYNSEAIQSIETISEDFSLNAHKNTIKGFAIKEGFDTFIEIINGYSIYKIENVKNEKAASHENIVEHVKTFISNNLFKEEDMTYKMLPTFIESYIGGIKSLLELTDKVKTDMHEAGVDADSISSVNNFMDEFMIKLQESFDPTMNQILWASGYNAKQRLARPKNDTPPVEDPVFL